MKSWWVLPWLILAGQWNHANFYNWERGISLMQQQGDFVGKLHQKIWCVLTGTCLEKRSTQDFWSGVSCRSLPFADVFQCRLSVNKFGSFGYVWSKGKGTLSHFISLTCWQPQVPSIGPQCWHPLSAFQRSSWTCFDLHGSIALFALRLHIPSLNLNLSTILVVRKER